MSLACDTESGQATSTPPSLLGYREINAKSNNDWQKRQFRQAALEAALKMSTTAEPEARLIQRATVIYNFLYGEEAK